MNKLPMTPAQEAKFWRLFKKAWLAAHERLGVPANSRATQNAWRHGILFQAAGVRSIRHLDRGEGYDAVMLRLAQEANDAKEIAYWATSTERRLRHMVWETCRAIGQIQGYPAGWDYVRGVCSRATPPRDIDDCTAGQLQTLLAILDTHRRRLLRRRGVDHALKLKTWLGPAAAVGRAGPTARPVSKPKKFLN